MTALILRYGTIAGLIVAIPMVWRMLTLGADSTDPLGGMLLGYATMLVALTAVFVGVRQYRDKVLGGVIRFLPALGIGLGISTVACVFYVVGWEISLAFSDFNFPQFYANAMLEGARAKGLSGAELEKVAADAKAFTDMYAKAYIRIPITFAEMFPVGLLVSLISAAVLRNSRVLPARN